MASITLTHLEKCATGFRLDKLLFLFLLILVFLPQTVLLSVCYYIAVLMKTQ